MLGFLSSMSQMIGELRNRDARWLVIFLCFVLIFWSWLTTYKWICEEYNSEMQGIWREHSNMAMAIEEHVRRTIAGVDEVLMFVKHEYETTGRVNEINSTYLQWAKANPVVDQQISIINENGYYVASSLPVDPKLNVSGQKYFRAHLSRQTGTVFIDQPAVSKTTGKMVIPLSRRIDKPDGSFGGIVSVDLDPEYFFNFYKQMKISNSQNIAIIGLDGIVRARYYGNETSLGQEIGNRDFLEKVKEQPQGTLEIRSALTRQDRILSYRLMNDYPLIINVSIAKDDALSDFEVWKRRQYTSTGIITIVTLVFGGLAVGRIKQQLYAYKKSELQQAQLTAMLDNIPHLAWLKDLDGKYMEINRPYLELLGLTRADVLGKYDYDFWPEDVAAAYRREDQRVITSGKQTKVMDKKPTRKGILSVETYKSPVFGPNGELLGTAGIALDITERRDHEEEIYRMAYYDSLTHLPNRIYLKECLEMEMDKVRRLNGAGAVLYIDMDDFKMVNETLGHSYGDEVILAVGNHLVEEVNENAVVARISADEFIILLPDLSDQNQADALAGRIVKKLSHDYRIGDSISHLSATVGIALYPRDGNTAEEILKNADIALYTAKEKGKNTWLFYNAGMQKNAYDNMVLKRSLRSAVAHDELSLHYQPQLMIADHSINGFEALVRWASAEHGEVSPERFIPLAEETESIHEIGVWVLKQACKFARKLADLGKSRLRVWVNVSPRQLCAENFVSTVDSVIRDAGITPGQLGLEITENVFIDSMEECVVKLRQLEAMGLALSLDDFGTGYSSLTYLRSLPVKTLKIDKSFIAPIGSDEMQVSFVNSIVAMAHVLGLSVVAEGVETQAQLERLIQCQCDCVQGYIFSRPVPDQEALRLLSNEWTDKK